MFRELSVAVVALAVFCVVLDEGMDRQRFNRQEKERNGHLCHRLFKKNLISALVRKRINRGYYLSQLRLQSNDMLALAHIRDNMWRVPDEDIDWERASKGYKAIAKSPWTDQPVHEEFFQLVLREGIFTDGKRKCLHTPQSLALWNERVRAWGKKDETEEKQQDENGPNPGDRAGD